MTKFLIGLGILFILVQACQDNTDTAAERKNGYTPVLKDRGDSLYHEVMKGHDTGMAKIGRLTGSIKRLNFDIDSLKKQKKPDLKLQQVLVSVREDLVQAEYSMNTWMHEFVADSAQNDKEKRIAYLESEKIKVNKMKDRILSGLARFDSLYKK
jgi:hypothetical protein